MAHLTEVPTDVVSGLFDPRTHKPIPCVLKQGQLRLFIRRAWQVVGPDATLTLYTFGLELHPRLSIYSPFRATTSCR